MTKRRNNKTKNNKKLTIMKKILFSILAMAAMAACATDETVVASKGEAIEFGNAFVDNSVRATDPSHTANGIDSFKVYGTVDGGQGAVLIYPGTVVSRTKTGETDKAYGTEGWFCDVKQYWVAGANYNFVGIVDGEVSRVTETVLTNNMPTTIKYTADGATDLLCQTITKTASTDGSSNGLVAFTFQHLLSKVNFTVTNGSTEAEGYSFVVKNIKFSGNTYGECDVQYPTTNTSAKAVWNSEKFTTGDTFVGNTREVGGNTVKDIVVATGAASKDLATEVLFLPGTYTISFTVDILCNGTLLNSTNYPTTGTYEYTLVENNAYNFNVAVSVGELIEFTATQMGGWDNAGTTTTVTLQ